MIILASKSPRRRDLLGQLGIEFRQADVDVPEQPRPGEAPGDYVARVAREKAAAGLALAPDGALVVGADTEVVLDDVVFGKPADADAALAMLSRLAGREHRVISSVCVLDASRQVQFDCVSRVHFAPLGRDRLEHYVASGEWQGKAGGYAIQGRGAALVSHLEGSYSAVMGLPLFETASALRQFGIEV